MTPDQERELLTCDRCGDEFCPHGVCSCADERCRECARRQELEREAEREAAFQRDVAGPLLGFDEEDGAA